MNRLLRVALVAALTCAITTPALATRQIRTFDNPAQRERYRALLSDLRCLVCQNQSLASSDADLADDLRDEVYRLVVTEGRSRSAAIDFLTERYGDFVLYRPPVRPTTWLLWFGPLLLLIVGSLIAAAVVRRRARSRPLTPDEHRLARGLLDSDAAPQTSGTQTSGTQTSDIRTSDNREGP